MSRCHGPHCTRDAVVDYFCGQDCQTAWHAQLGAPLPPDPPAALGPLPPETRLVWVPTLADPAAPTFAELDAGIELTPHVGVYPRQAEVERLTVAIRAVCPPEHLNAVMTEAFERSLDSPRIEALQSVCDDLAHGWLPASTGAAYPQVASRRGWLRRALEALYGRTT